MLHTVHSIMLSKQCGSLYTWLITSLSHEATATKRHILLERNTTTVPLSTSTTVPEYKYLSLNYLHLTRPISVFRIRTEWCRPRLRAHRAIHVAWQCVVTIRHVVLLLGSSGTCIITCAICLYISFPDPHVRPSERGSGNFSRFLAILVLKLSWAGIWAHQSRLPIKPHVRLLPNMLRSTWTFSTTVVHYQRTTRSFRTYWLRKDGRGCKRRPSARFWAGEMYSFLVPTDSGKIARCCRPCCSYNNLRLSPAHSSD